MCGLDVIFSMYCVIGRVLCRMFYTLALGRFSHFMLGYYILRYYNISSNIYFAAILHYNYRNLLLLLSYIYIVGLYFRIRKCLHLLCTLFFTLVLGNVLSLSVVPVHFIYFTVG